MMICLDANCVIYLIEKNPLWGPKVVARLAAAKAAGDAVAVGDLARAECLIGPLKSGDAPVLSNIPHAKLRNSVKMFTFGTKIAAMAG